MKKNHLVIIISVVIIVVGAIVAKIMIDNKPKPTPPKKLETVRYAKMDEVKYDEYSVNINATGTVRAKDKIDIYSEVQGIYDPTGKPFREGISFSKGEVMLSIDKREAEFTLKTQKSDLMNSIASLMADFKTDFPQSFEKWNDYLSNFDIEKNIKEFPKPNSDKEKYFLTIRKIYSQYYNIKNQEVRLSKFEIVAPFNGTVTMSAIEPGALVRPAAKIGEFSGRGLYEVTFSVSSSDLNYVKIGSSVDVIHNENKTAGRVVRISDRIDPTTQSVNVFVQVSSADFKDGMYVNGRVDGNKVTNVYKIPREAIINNTEIYTMKDGKLALENIDLVFVGKNFAYIRGLDAGKTVIVESLANVKLGTKLKRKDS
ncbi:MAG: HlyD family efflux transporter periplasmic adaptor subunit [Candidatus Kapaibacterium sp.]